MSIQLQSESQPHYRSLDTKRIGSKRCTESKFQLHDNPSQIHHRSILLWMEYFLNGNGVARVCRSIQAGKRQFSATCQLQFKLSLHEMQ